MRSNIRARVWVSPKLAETPTMSNSGLDSARPRAKASSISSPMSLSMMIFSRAWAGPPRMEQPMKNAAAMMAMVLRMAPLDMFEGHVRPAGVWAMMTICAKNPSPY